MTNLKELDEKWERLNNGIDEILFITSKIADLSGKEGARELEDSDELDLEELSSQLAYLEEESSEVLNEINKFI